MPDNTTLPTGSGGDTIRTLDKTGTGTPKTEVVALDVAGGDGRGENILTFPVPTALADVPQDDDGLPTVTLSQPSIDALESVLRQLIAAQTAPASPAGPGPALNIAVGVTSVLILAANPNRKGAVFTNVSTSGQRIALGLAGPAVLDSGIVLWPGDEWAMDYYTFTPGAISGIASAASGAMAVQEFS